MDTIFLTGATGFLGTWITRFLVRDTRALIFALVRAATDAAAVERLRREWWEFPDLLAALGGRVQVLAGDLCSSAFGLPPSAYRDLSRRTTHIIHSAADIRLFAPLPELRAANVEGTRAVLSFAREVHADHGLARLAHISTAYVAGARPGRIAEADLSGRYGFLSPYEKSKYEAETLVRAETAGYPVSIFRPGMIVGDSREGRIKTFNTLYTPLRLYLTGRISVSPARPGARVNLVPVDYVARAVARLLFEPRAAGRTFHLTPPSAAAPTQAEMAAFTRDWAKREMDLHLPLARFIPLPAGKASALLFRALLGSKQRELAQLLPYFQHQPEFLRDNSDELLGPYPHDWRDLLAPLLSYAVRHSFWQRAARTVHEQILHRLHSRTRPIRYHDLSAGTHTLRSAAEMRAEIKHLVAALRAAGMHPGDRVAIVGLNHSRYFSLLVACGLCGLVVVPFYATSAPAEIESLLKDCRPRLFFVGAPAVLERLDEIDCPVPIVSFLPSSRTATSGVCPVQTWQDFLAQAAGQSDSLPDPLPFDAPAVMVYTSGTTGTPKAVVYTHAQLRWLGETLASMYPWRERNRWGAYLSYLPMNHVVEGILAMYSPYYVPAALDIYFSDDFAALGWALRVARPTIFFSVPRFFEKVRALFSQNPLAQTYAALRPGLLREGLKRLLRRGLLRKTGLDRCRQMIVGSAPSALELLAFFADFGIPIHNAYGLTEAPLVSLNRLGRNRIDTLGEPLPETQIRIAADGEIQVRGPQVAAGYIREGTLQPFNDGWLPTGDLGALTPEGYLLLDGRKKDLIVTAYGKKVFPAPLEAGLRTISGVSEALLIGDDRSYLSAFLWLEEGVDPESCLPGLRSGVELINARLNHADQIRRWAVLSEPLSPRDGSMTGSLKVKRDILTARFNHLIDTLYRGDLPPAGVFFDQSAQPPR